MARLTGGPLVGVKVITGGVVQPAPRVAVTVTALASPLPPAPWATDDGAAVTELTAQLAGVTANVPVVVPCGTLPSDWVTATVCVPAVKLAVVAMVAVALVVPVIDTAVVPVVGVYVRRSGYEQVPEEVAVTVMALLMPFPPEPWVTAAGWAVTAATVHGGSCTVKLAMPLVGVCPPFPTSVAVLEPVVHVEPLALAGIVPVQ